MRGSVALHVALLLVWSALVIPTVLWWRDSVGWVSLMSIYAIIVSHAAALEAAVAARNTKEKGQ